MRRLNELGSKRVALIIFIIGVCTFFTGLNNPFQGDDNYQIVNNVPVHSVSNIVQFFRGSTFYNGQELTGVFYRPLMTTTFSLIYSIFGAHPVAFHIVQLLIFLTCVFLLYLILHTFIKPILALVLSLIFLVHPLNSQIVFSIPTMQDVLLLLFGLLAMWTIINFKSTRSLFWAMLFLFLALLSKEIGILFLVLAITYLILFDHKRVSTFIYFMILPLVLYLALRINAVGFNTSQHIAPIDNATLVERLYTAPAVVWFYITKLIFPWKLATGYYWVNTSFGVRSVLLQLMADMAVLALVIAGGIWLKSKHSGVNHLAFWFFASWSIIALLPYLQVMPLDMTISESWFYFSMVGLLGMIGVSLQAIKRIPLRPEWMLVAAVILVGLLGIRTALRGTDYSSQYKLATRDISVSKDDYAALISMSQYFIDQGRYKEAAMYAQRSIDIYPAVTNYTNLGVALEQEGNYAGASLAYNEALKYGNLSTVYENLALIYLVYSKPSSTNQFFEQALNRYPEDAKLWLYYAVFEGAIDNNVQAKVAISNAAKYGLTQPVIYDTIMQDRTLTLRLLGKEVLIR